MKLVSAELGACITLYNLLARELTEEVDTIVSSKCEKDFEYKMATHTKLVGEIFGKIGVGYQARFVALSQEHNSTRYALQSQALAAGIEPHSAQILQHPDLIEIQNQMTNISTSIQTCEKDKTARELKFFHDTQLVKQKIMAQDLECLAVNAALESWPTDQIPKLIRFGTAKREGAQEQSGEGSAILSKTNNHNTNKQPTRNPKLRNKKVFPNSKWVGPKRSAAPG